MSARTRLNLLSDNQAALDKWFKLTEYRIRDADAEASESRRNRLESLRELGAQASLEEELRLRISSDLMTPGALPLLAGDLLFRPLEDVVSALAESQIGLEITGISSGSTVLHVRPTGAPEPPIMEGPQVDTSSGDPAMRALVRLLSALESESDVREWARSLVSLDRLASGLARYDATLSVTWYASNGDVASTQFGEGGRRYLKTLMETHSEDEPRTLSGRVTELRESGVVRVKMGVARNAPAFDVRFEPGDLLGLHLTLGETVHFLVTETRFVDETGTVRSTEWRFLRRVEGAETLDV